MVAALTRFYQDRRHEAIIIWRSNEPFYKVQNEHFVLPAMKAAEEKTKYNQKKYCKHADRNPKGEIF